MTAPGGGYSVISPWMLQEHIPGSAVFEAAALCVRDSSAVALFLSPEGSGPPKHSQATPELGKSQEQE